jgi:hypothetical protein
MDQFFHLGWGLVAEEGNSGEEFHLELCHFNLKLLEYSLVRSTIKTCNVAILETNYSSCSRSIINESELPKRLTGLKFTHLNKPSVLSILLKLLQIFNITSKLCHMYFWIKMCIFGILIGGEIIKSHVFFSLFLNLHIIFIFLPIFKELIFSTVMQPMFNGLVRNLHTDYSSDDNVKLVTLLTVIYHFSQCFDLFKLQKGGKFSDFIYTQLFSFLKELNVSNQRWKFIEIWLVSHFKWLLE